MVVGANGTFTFDAHNPKFELHTDEAPFAMPEHHSLNPMGRWTSTQRESNVVRQDRWQSFDLDPPGQLADVSAFTGSIENDVDPEMNVRFAASPTEVILAGF